MPGGTRWRLAIGWVAAVAFAAPDRAADSYQQGVRLAGAGEWAAAIPPLEQAVAHDPRNAQYLKALGVAQAKLDEAAAAAEWLGRACRIDPRLPDACYYWAQSLITLSRFGEALRALDAAADSIPAGRRLTAEAHALEGLNRPDEAEARYRKAIEQPDFAAESRHRFGVFLYRRGRPREAVAPLEDAVSRRPASAEYATDLGRVYLQLDRWPDAERALAQALAADPGHRAARLLLDRLDRRRSLPPP